MEEIINKIFKEKYPKGLSAEYTKEEMIGYMIAINDIKEYNQRPIKLEDFVHGFEFEMWDDFEKKWYKHTYSIFPPQNEERFYYSLQTLSKFRRI